MRLTVSSEGTQMHSIKQYLSHIKLKNLLFFILVSMICIVMGVVISISRSGFKRTLLDQAYQNRRHVLLQVSEKVHQVYQSALIISNLYYYSADIDTIIETNPKYLTPDRTYDYNIRLKNMVANYRNMLANFDIPYYFVLSCNNGYNYLSKTKYKEYDFSKYKELSFFEDMETNGTRLTIWGPYEDQLSNEDHESVLVFGRMLMNSIHQPSGFFLVNIPETSLSGLYESVSANSTIFIVAGDGTIISSGNKEYLGHNYNEEFGGFRENNGITSTINDVTYLTTIHDIDDLGITIIEQIPTHFLLEPIEQITKQIIGICILLFLLFVCIAYLISWLTARQIQKLCRCLESVGNGDLNTDFHVTGWYEICQINYVCSRMLLHIRQLIADIRQKELQKRKAEINFLQSQINPHFVYNTLFSASCLIQMKEYKNASDMILDLISLMRWTFKTKSEFITVEESINHLMVYINIMKYRYSDKFEVEIDLSPEIKEKKIINLLLQPLVENSIFHGIDPCSHPCILSISVCPDSTEEFVNITIEDDGIGMDCEKLKEVRERLSSADHDHGMNNVVERLNAHFENNYTFTIDSEPGQGTILFISCPAVD